jgi:DNA-binding Lrp family transcriptional regulator
VHDTDILDIAEKMLGFKAVTIPSGVDAVLFLRLEAHIYTTSVSRKIKNMKGVEKLYEMSGDEDIAIYASLKNVAELNNLIEDIRSIPGVLATSTRVVLKKYGDNNGNSC